MSTPEPRGRSHVTNTPSSSEYSPSDLDDLISPTAPAIGSSPPSVGEKSSSDYSPPLELQDTSPTGARSSAVGTGTAYSTGNTPTHSEFMEDDNGADRETNAAGGMLQQTCSEFVHLGSGSDHEPTLTTFMNTLASSPQASKTARPDFESWRRIVNSRKHGHESFREALACGASAITHAKKKTTHPAVETESTSGFLNGFPLERIPWEDLVPERTLCMSTMALRSGVLQACLALWELHNQDLVIAGRKQAAQAAADGFCAEMEIEAAGTSPMRLNANEIDLGELGHASPVAERVVAKEQRQECAPQ